MAKPRSLYLSLAGLEYHVREWGDPSAPAIVMWHGLARVGSDFDVCARHFADRFHILCPDTIGRGLSQWSSQPDADYTIPSYCSHAIEMLDRLNVETCHWVGTSMGGLVGMALAGTDAGRGRINRLVLNDIAPVLNHSAVERIKNYVSIVPEFDSMMQLEAFLRVAYAPFGHQTDEEWRAMAEASVRRRDNGKFSSHYDPAVMRVFADQFEHFDMWPLYDAITCPTLALRGEASDLILPEIAQEMTLRGPKAQLVIVPGCGHAPALNVPSQIAVLEGFLG